MDTNNGQVTVIEGEDYYLENGLMVLTAGYLLRRGFCCEQGCRHCPYSDLGEEAESNVSPEENHA